MVGHTTSINPTGAAGDVFLFNVRQDYVCPDTVLPVVAPCKPRPPTAVSTALKTFVVHWLRTVLVDVIWDSQQFLNREFDSADHMVTHGERPADSGLVRR